MKKLLYIVFVLCPVAIWSQPASSFDFGGGVGLSSYYGDINQEKFFYNANLAFEGFVRYNFNRRYAVRVHVMGTELKGEDADFRNLYQQSRNQFFKRSITEIGVVGEVNFFPYVNPWEWEAYIGTIYGLVGVGQAISYSRINENTNILNILMGVGYKRALRNRWALEVEWAFRKCLNDELDGIVDPIKTGKKSTLFNNDWYNVLAIKLSYNLWQNDGRCRTFERD